MKYVLSLIAALVLYLLLGAPETAWDVQKYRAIEAESEPLRVQLAAKERWAELGDMEMALLHHNAAAEAYRKAVLKSGGDARLILQYNKALVFAASGTVTDHAKKGFEMVLKMLPKNPEARYFLAVRKMQDGDTEAAMKEMRALFKELPDDSPLKQMMRAQIGG